MVEKRFVIPVERRWKLLVLPILALLYFIALVLLVALGYEIAGVSMDYLVFAGIIFFVIVLIIELPFLLKKRVRVPEEEVAFEEEVMAEPDMPAPEPARGPVITGDEYMLTTETLSGLRVAEYSYPAKSINVGTVYAKTVIPVTKEHVLRIESFAADPSEL